MKRYGCFLKSVYVILSIRGGYVRKVKLHEIFLSSMQIGFTAFGGGAATLSLIRKMVVDDKKWIDSDTFDQMAIVANILPGPVILQMLALIHYKTRGFVGAFVALIPTIFLLPLIFVWSVTLFETIIPKDVMHKITLALIPFIILLTSEYVLTLIRTQKDRNQTSKDWFITIVLSIFAATLLFFKISTTIVIFLYLTLIVAYALFEFKKEGGKHE